MQRIANLLAVQDGKVLLMQKPRRGWYVAPGGKMESGESIIEAAIREFQEETSATPKDVHLKGVFTIVIKEDGLVVDEWMLFTFVSNGIIGTPVKENREGKLDWHPIESLHHLPMAEGDRDNLLFVCTKEGIQYGTFEYTKDYELLSSTLQSSTEQQ
ncbi:NUDIX domain-containing protein [Ureibacillus acetophenoni]|uniref:8-oxo-dGTP diphosphatase n=1 Tax=Ureibacillus acetophenoni TaxID=614649 RepID=A0A285UE91_9BACL|nr:8-oxo-dGTP diphosphatase [Ureibacillus acetophenoni]SOC40142.1 8-oxo-dGTP diphosphatase [Ureibacillus acetophenoni]